MLQPVVRRTWAPRGRTPIQWQWNRHDRLSVISAITLAPQRKRIGLYWQIHRKNIKAVNMIGFFYLVHYHLRRDLIIIMDRWSVHRAALVRNYLEHHKRNIQVEWLPGYAPDLNPVEQVWNQAKYSYLANVAPKNIDELDELVHFSIGDQCKQSHLLRSFFQTAKLEL